MKDSLKPGLTFEFQYKIPEDKTVPYLYQDIPESQVMPKVFATGFMVGLFEFACFRYQRSTTRLSSPKSELTPKSRGFIPWRQSLSVDRVPKPESFWERENPGNPFIL